MQLLKAVIPEAGHSIFPKKNPPWRRAEGDLMSEMKREPVFGPNARPVLVQFFVGLLIMFTVSWLFWKPAYDFVGLIIAPLFR
jgi:hypothetical protein